MLERSDKLPNIFNNHMTQEVETEEEISIKSKKKLEIIIENFCLNI